MISCFIAIKSTTSETLIVNATLKSVYPLCNFNKLCAILCARASCRTVYARVNCLHYLDYGLSGMSLSLKSQAD